MIKLIYNLIFIVLLSLNFSISHADKKFEKEVNKAFKKFEKNLNKQKKKLNKLPKAYSEESKIIDKAIIEIDKTKSFLNESFLKFETTSIPP